MPITIAIKSQYIRTGTVEARSRDIQGLFWGFGVAAEISGGEKKKQHATTDKVLTPFGPLSSSKKKENPTKTSTMKRGFVSLMPDFKRGDPFSHFGPRGFVSGLHAFTSTTQINATTKEKSCQHAGRKMDLFPLETQILKRNIEHIYTPKNVQI